MRAVGTLTAGCRGGLWAFLLGAAAAWPPGDAGPTPSWAGEGPGVENRLARPRGDELLRSRGCVNCHRLGEEGNPDARDLLRNPQDVNPGATMPSQPLTRWEAVAIAEFLSRPK